MTLSFRAFLTSLLFFTFAAHAQNNNVIPGNYLERQAVRDFIDDLSQRLNLPRAEMEAAFAQSHPIPKVIELIKPPANPQTRSWQRYRSRFIEPLRINAGRQFMRQHAATLAAAEAQYGVPASVIASIIGVETIYGRNMGNFNTFATLATLAFDYPPRADLFRRELESLIQLAHERNVSPLSFTGSFAGAIGLPQFLPSSIRGFAVDFDHDGYIDLRGNPVDAIGSVANYLAEYGWQAKQPIAARIPLTPDPAPSDLLAAGILPSLTAPQLSAAGITPPAQLSNDAKVALIDLVTPDQAPEYWLGWQNFYVITRYNRSSFYAMSVFQLAEALSQAETPKSSTSQRKTRKPQ